MHQCIAREIHLCNSGGEKQLILSGYEPGAPYINISNVSTPTQRLSIFGHADAANKDCEDVGLCLNRGEKSAGALESIFSEDLTTLVGQTVPIAFADLRWIVETLNSAPVDDPNTTNLQQLIDIDVSTIEGDIQTLQSDVVNLATVDSGIDSRLTSVEAAVATLQADVALIKTTLGI